jgi:hypothetical protein
MTDWLVGVLALALGLTGLAAACTQADWPLRWSLANELDKLAGRTAMRLAYVAIGLLLIFISASILRNRGQTRQWPHPVRSDGSQGQSR